MENEGEGRKSPPITIIKSDVKYEDVNALIMPYTDEELIEEYLRRYEDVAEVLELTKKQKLIFALKQFSGNVSTFIASRKVYQTYEQLRGELLNEFRDQISIADVHQKLQRTHKLQNEKYLEYFYKIQKLAATASIDTESVKFYIINGLRESREVDLQLRNTSTLDQLKELMKIMDLQQRQRTQQQPNFVQPRMLPRSYNQQRPFIYGTRWNGPRQQFFQPRNVFRQRFVPRYATQQRHNPPFRVGQQRFQRPEEAQISRQQPHTTSATFGNSS